MIEPLVVILVVVLILAASLGWWIRRSAWLSVGGVIAAIAVTGWAGRYCQILSKLPERTSDQEWHLIYTQVIAIGVPLALLLGVFAGLAFSSRDYRRTHGNYDNE
jgi:hypothetical protein